MVGSVISGNLVLVAVLALIISFGNGPKQADRVSAAATAPNAASTLDKVSSAGIAETVAAMGGLPEATAVTNQADSQATELTSAPVSASVIQKPQVVRTAVFASNKDIKTYVSVAGDTVTSVAGKFNVTSDSIRWSNNLSGDALSAGTKLQIPPVNGIVYTVQTGDTPATLAVKYQADAAKITAYNDAEISGLKVGEQILIPDGSKAAAVVAAARPAASASTWSIGSMTASYGYNGYDYGYCTWWVAKLRAAAGSPVPTNLGNAATWAVRAAAMGLSTGSTPRVGAAVVTSTRGAGHVAYVTGVNGDGSIVISEMNHAGWGVSDTRTISGAYQYVY